MGGCRIPVSQESLGVEASRQSECLAMMGDTGRGSLSRGERACPVNHPLCDVHQIAGAPAYSFNEKNE